MIKIYGLIIILVVLSGVGYGAVSYYNDTQERIATLRDNNAKLEVANKSKEEALKTIQSNVEKTNKLNKELQGKLQDAEVYQDELRRKLQKHDLTRLSEKKPGLVEKKINEGTQKLFNDFESITAK
ncbi:MAG: hypothetical protein CMC59_08325 [Flavobacteriaceae bacterium]|nr:hypothetical protein [Flavobacteriaceae bacterium]|tara:strand:- start:1316 stop:1693 length:378 start_codon:yes stop_codon:yes gene_type:complete